jgi:hypothetical protein
MLISEPIYAAAYRTPRSESRVFDDIGCLLKAAAQEPRADGLRFWFHDAATAVWIDGTEAVFVSSTALRADGGGIVAFRDAPPPGCPPAGKRSDIARPRWRLIDPPPSKEGGS